MNLIKGAWQLLINVDFAVNALLQAYGFWIYLILFLIIFIETGVVVFPFLPGDSLLFVSGTFAAAGTLNVYLLFIILSFAAILGDSINYAIGRYLGPKVFYKEHGKFLKKEYLHKTQEFYEKHGGKTIIIARFMPFIRTFAPFVAGIGRMQYSKFLAYNIVGAILWVCLFVSAGYFFGNIPFVKNNLTAVVLVIIFLSLLPGIIEYLKRKL
ncbi:MAG: DedA family protein [Nanoarchaeota archaeon]